MVPRGPDVAGDAGDAGRIEGRAHVVEHQPLDRRAGQAGQRHADQPAHRRAQPVEPLGIEPGQQGDRIGHVGLDRIGHRVGQPIRFAAAGEIRADDAKAFAQRSGQDVEIAALPAQPVAPLPIGQAMQAACIEALHLAQARLAHAAKPATPHERRRSYL